MLSLDFTPASETLKSNYDNKRTQDISACKKKTSEHMSPVCLFYFHFPDSHSVSAQLSVLWKECLPVILAFERQRQEDHREWLHIRSWHKTKISDISEQCGEPDAPVNRFSNSAPKLLNLPTFQTVKKNIHVETYRHWFPALGQEQAQNIVTSNTVVIEGLWTNRIRTLIKKTPERDLIPSTKGSTVSKPEAAPD